MAQSVKELTINSRIKSPDPKALTQGTDPYNPRLAWRTSILLHPGAERYYRDRGYID